MHIFSLMPWSAKTKDHLTSHLLLNIKSIPLKEVRTESCGHCNGLLMEYVRTP